MTSEFELIARFFQKKSHRSDVVLGIGDDAAMLAPPPDMDVIVTVDTLVAGIHFPPETDPESIGHKALAVNLSDLAAMGAKPAWFTLSLTLPHADNQWLSRFSHGMFSLADRFEVDLVGGDMTHGALSMTIQAMGFTPKSKALRRQGARPGDAIYVTGCIGDAGLGLAAVKSPVRLDPASLEYCLSRLNRPMPRVEIGLMLLNLASSAIDVSDGLAADLGHILTASGVGADVQLSSIPLSKALRDFYGEQPDWQTILGSGDDYELVFTVSEYQVEKLHRAFENQEVAITRIGSIHKNKDLRFKGNKGARLLLQHAGYNHFGH